MATMATTQQQQQQPKFYTIVWYGERFYAAAGVDAELRRASHELENVTSQLIAVRSNVETIGTLFSKSNGNNNNNNISSEYWTAVANDGTAEYYEPKSGTTDITASLAQEGTGSSPRSTCSGGNRSYGCGGGGGARGRTIGKRNQEFYIPHGVLLSHTTTTTTTAHTDLEGEGDEWFGRYDKESNKIIRTVICANGANADNDLDEYETLKHFAQEHDREMYQELHKGVQEYRECNTPNVWTNPLFKFYNTVSLKWEPLSALRTDI